jgi:soluble lytic murein transglycosylase-like protein
MSLEADLRAVCDRIAHIAAPLNDADPSRAQVPAEFAALVQGAAAQNTARPVPDAIADLARRAGARSALDPALIEAVIANESSYDPHALSAAGAQGLMQLMPSTAAALGVDPTDPAQNVAGGARYLRSLFDRFGGNLPQALAAYNAGPGAVQQFGGIPPYAETRAYVDHVLATYHALTRR